MSDKALFKKCYDEHFESLIRIANLVARFQPCDLKDEVNEEIKNLSKQLTTNGLKIWKEIIA